ncbi:anaerobic sulfatase maturase [Virgibacillus soli]
MQTLSILIKPASSSCNLSCHYCFYHDVAEHRNVKSFGRMRDHVRKEIIRKAFASHVRVVSFAFQGGEPTLAGLDFFQAFVREVEEHNTNHISVHYSLQTNGYALNEAWISFLKENHFLVGISLDGPKEIHDYGRVTNRGKPTHKRVMQTIRLLEKFSVPFNILCVLTSYTARHITKVYNFFQKQGFKYVQFIPCLEPLEGEEIANYSMSAEEYADALHILFRKYRENILARNYISDRLFDNFIGMCMGQEPENCSMAGACSTYFTIEANGDVFPCDFYALDTYKMGNIMEKDYEEMFTGEVATAFRKESEPLSDACQTCKYVSLCRGGCKRYKQLAPTTSQKQFVYCESYYTFFEKNVAAMFELAQQVRRGIG